MADSTSCGRLRHAIDAHDVTSFVVKQFEYDSIIKPKCLGTVILKQENCTQTEECMLGR